MAVSGKSGQGGIDAEIVKGWSIDKGFVKRAELLLEKTLNIARHIAESLKSQVGVVFALTYLIKRCLRKKSLKNLRF
jgi:hypothetical protein